MLKRKRAKRLQVAAGYRWHLMVSLMARQEGHASQSALVRRVVGDYCRERLRPSAMAIVRSAKPERHQT